MICTKCDGKGGYGGLLKVEICDKCEGKGTICSFWTPVAMADVANYKRHIYPKWILETVVADSAEVVKSRSLIGELDSGPADTAPINLANASHVITGLKMENDLLMAEIEVIMTPLGRILRTLLNDQIKVFFRPRGFGTGKVIESGNLVLETYKLITIDAYPPY